ncbi:MAG: RNA polymerase sigma factor [Acidimicrobiales bacterium]|nr:RNA polymerase sigma factor [Acidimicrobiales bacterium]
MRRPLSPVEVTFRTEWAPIVATLVRQFGDLDLAEDATQEAFLEASRRWRQDGVPANPAGWLVLTARRKVIDRIRREKRYKELLAQVGHSTRDESADSEPRSADLLALLFGCCHPALSTEAQVALTLRSLGGLTTGQIARAFLVPEATMAKRLVRAKNKIRTAGIPFQIPATLHERADRLRAVHAVIYAIFTEGHAASDGETTVRGQICDEAIWLANKLVELMPDDSESHGLAALCLLTDARRPARVGPDGQQILLADQDRSLWDQSKIRSGLLHLQRADDLNELGPYGLMAAMASFHSTTPSFDETPWNEIIGLYDRILDQHGGAVVALNRAVAVAERDGPEAGLAALAELGSNDELDGYRYFHSARAELLARSGHLDEAATAFRAAIAVCENEGERQWFQTRLKEVSRSNN